MKVIARILFCSFFFQLASFIETIHNNSFPDMRVTLNIKHFHLYFPDTFLTWGKINGSLSTE